MNFTVKRLRFSKTQRLHHRIIEYFLLSTPYLHSTFCTPNTDFNKTDKKNQVDNMVQA
jgi:hypothetical protein